jgi:hypothetical protein
MKRAITRAAKCACTKASATMVTIDQLDRELASTRPQSPPSDPAMSAAWHHNNGLAVPDHLTTEPGLTTQEAGSLAEATPTKPAGIPQPDPRPPLGPYTDVPMEDVKNIDDWVPSSS